MWRLLKKYSNCIEHVDDEGRNVLHVEIKYRQLKIFELVARMEVPMKRLVRKLDNDGNSNVHTIRRKKVPMKRLVRKLDNDGNSNVHTIRRKRKDLYLMRRWKALHSYYRKSCSGLR